MSDEKLNANSTLDKVLGYVDSPFKLFAILVMEDVATLIPNHLLKSWFKLSH